MKKIAFVLVTVFVATFSHAEVTIESFGKDIGKIKATLADCKNRAVNLHADTADAQKCRAAKLAMRDLAIQPYKATTNGTKF